ncbi:MAG TPA: YicC/YloC family endoribonuclease [Phycisphaerales bacterium]|nr:YicC/YloC family endoribonuclease [Phycisphaerales bacterium]
MIRSMTGYGEASSTAGSAHFYLEVRSLNSKYFKAVIRLPEEFQVLEAELETQLRHRLNRGSVFMTIRHSDVSGDVAHTLNEHALARYIEQLGRVPQIVTGAVKIEIAPLLGLPGVLQPPQDEERRLNAARVELLKLLDEACEGLVKMREREGQYLVSDLLSHHDAIAGLLAQIKQRAPQVMVDHEKRLKARIEQMIKEMGLQVQSVDIVRELAITAERVDISEEIARLSGHLDQFTIMLKEKEFKPIGRTLDFLTQEMLREANTIASKCNDAEISRWCVEVKGSIDRIKEQVQNVE